MTSPPRPHLDPADDLTHTADIDLNTALSPLLAQRALSPILRPSRAVDVAALVDTRYPQGGDTLDDLVAQITHANNQCPRRNTHPGFFGWVAPSGMPTDPLAHAMVAALNENVGGYWSSPVGTTIERTVIGWLADLAGFPAEAEGVLLSGGSLGNTTGIASALAKKFGVAYRQKGLQAFSQPSSPVVICSQAAHFSIRRAAAMLGIGTDNVIAVATDAQFCMQPDKLAEALAQHANVVCVVASAGTTNTGAIDPLDSIATLCKEHGVWLHVDAAYGGGGLLSQTLRSRYKGIEHADSVVMDLHKWFFQSLDGSVLLYRDANAARTLFYDNPDYLQTGGDTSPEQYMFFHISPELSRRFRALPFYLALRHYGIERLGRNALHNVQCADYLADLIRREDNLELIAAPQLSILCYRFTTPGLSDARIDAINTGIRDKIQLEGDYLMSATQVNGRPVLRVCIINHATRAEHIEGLVASVLRIGRSMKEKHQNTASETI